MKTDDLIKELVEAAEQLGLDVRAERGSFRGGLCFVEDRPVIVLNKRQPTEANIAILAEVLKNQPLDNVFIKPSVRSALESSWASRDQEIESFDVE